MSDHQAFAANKPRGVPRVDDRRVLNGIMWRFRSGATWAEVPERYGPSTTCYNWFVRWRKAGVWDRLLDNGEQRCIAFGGLRVDDAIKQAILPVLEPGAIAATVDAEAQAANRRDQIRDALMRDFEAARYAADRSFRQYDAADPLNRLVAAELGGRWNRALTRVSDVESRIATHDASTQRSEMTPLRDLAGLAADLHAVWRDQQTDARLKKRIVRTLIQGIIADIDRDASEIALLVHWAGGVHTELRLPRRRKGQRNSTPDDVIAAVRQLVLIANDELIAGILNRNGLQTGHGNKWTRERGTALRPHHKIPIFRAEKNGDAPWLNLSQAALQIGVTPKTLRAAVEAGEIDGIHPLPDGPWIFSRDEIGGSAARQLAKRARQNPKYPTGSHPDQQSLFSSTT